jgi:hypothetical protein
VIGWEVDVALQRELQDTRIPAGQERRFEQAFPLPDARGWSVELRMVVRPGEHYERTFRHSLARESSFPAAARAPLREALAQVKAAEYELLSLRRPLAATVH